MREIILNSAVKEDEMVQINPARVIFETKSLAIAGVE